LKYQGNIPDFLMFAIRVMQLKKSNQSFSDKTKSVGRKMVVWDDNKEYCCLLSKKQKGFSGI
jgi:hypothetical protein